MTVEETKGRIIEWCENEGFKPQIQPNQGAQFHIVIHVSDYTLDIVQKASPDGFSVITRMLFVGESYRQIDSLEPERKQELISDLHLTLASNPDILEFSTNHDQEGRTWVVFMASKPIFYDGLSKHVLMSRVYEVLKAMYVVKMKINKATGAPPIACPQFDMYT